MKKFTYLLIALFVAIGVNAQTLSKVKSSGQPLPQKNDFDLHYDGDNDDAIGTGGERTFSVLAKFTSTELSSYYGKKNISKLKFFINEAYLVPTARLLIYGTGSDVEPGDLLYEEPITSIVDGWNEFPLSNSFPLESGDYWVGYELNATGGWPAGCDVGPMVKGKGGWIYFNDAWQELTDFGIDCNWNIRATLTDATGIETEIGQTSNVIGGNGIITINNADAATAQIFNVTGQLVNTVNLSKSATVEVPAGVYVVRVGKVVQKVLVK